MAEQLLEYTENCRVEEEVLLTIAPKLGEYLRYFHCSAERHSKSMLRRVFSQFYIIKLWFCSVLLKVVGC